MDYNKEEIKQFLAKEYNWQWYGGHHMENRTAYFANNYVFHVSRWLLMVTELARNSELTPDSIASHVAKIS